MSLQPIIKRIKCAWHHFMERHYMINAETEQRIEKQAQRNIAYFHKRAAMARSKRAALR